MQLIKIASIAAIIAISLSACREEPEAVDVAPPPPAPAPAPTPKEEPEPKSLFAPLNKEHAENMKTRAAEIAEIDRRIDESAKKQAAEFVKEIEAKLAEYRDYYHKTYGTDVMGGVKEYEDKLAIHYVQSVKQSEGAVRKGGLNVLADQMLEEIKSVEAGNKPPRPPEESDNSNPGLKLLYDLRRSYYGNYANIEKAVTQSRSDLTSQYKAQLQQYHDYAKDITPPEAAQKIAAELKWLEGEWWADK